MIPTYDNDLTSTNSDRDDDDNHNDDDDNSCHNNGNDVNDDNHDRVEYSSRTVGRNGRAATPIIIFGYFKL